MPFTLITVPPLPKARGSRSKYTPDDANFSPPLAWSGAPDGTRSFALMLDDRLVFENERTISILRHATHVLVGRFSASLLRG